MKASELLTKEHKKKIVDSIQQAETNTSGEIRVHLESLCNGDPCERAVYVFSHLKMQQTKDRNGVLIYLAVKSRKFAIIGDVGINEKVGTDYWNDTKDMMADHFRKGEFAEGLAEAVLSVGEKLKAYFPYQRDDVNELSDEISIGD